MWLGELARVCSTPQGYVQIYGHKVTPDNLHHWEAVALSARSQGKKAQYRINSDLALSRALGDKDLRRFGVVFEPELRQHTICPAALPPASTAAGTPAQGGTAQGPVGAGARGSGSSSSSSSSALGGVTAEVRVLGHKDQFMIMASDGIWDVLSSRQCVALVSQALQQAARLRTTRDGREVRLTSCEQARLAAAAVVEHAHQWTNDDVTCLVVVFQS